MSLSPLNFHSVGCPYCLASFGKRKKKNNSGRMISFSSWNTSTVHQSLLFKAATWAISQHWLKHLPRFCSDVFFFRCFDSLVIFVYIIKELLLLSFTWDVQKCSNLNAFSYSDDLRKHDKCTFILKSFLEKCVHICHFHISESNNFLRSISVDLMSKCIWLVIGCEFIIFSIIQQSH